MKLSDLQARGGFVVGGLIPREIVWPHTIDGEEVTDIFTVFVERLSFGVIERAVNSMGNQRDDVDRSVSAALIAAAIRLGDNGEERLTYDQAYALNPSLAKLLANAVNEVNEFQSVKP